MSTSVNPLPNFGINSIHKFILYVATVIFITSLFVPIQGFDTILVQKKALSIMGFGVVAWFLYTVITNMGEIEIESKRNYNNNAGLGHFIALRITQFLYIAISIIIMAN